MKLLIRTPAERPAPPAAELDSVVREPATPEACRQDYAAGIGERAALDRTARRQYPGGGPR